MSSYYVDEIDGVFFTDRTAATEQEFRDRIQPIEEADEAEESLRERLIDALDAELDSLGLSQGISSRAAYYLAQTALDVVTTPVIAAAAVAAYRATQDGGAEEAVRRVEELFAGGPDTACRTTWRREAGWSLPGNTEPLTECVEVPLDDLQDAFDRARAALAPQAGDAEAVRDWRLANAGCCPRCGWHLSSHMSSYGPQSDCPQGASPSARDGSLRRAQDAGLRRQAAGGGERGADRAEAGGLPATRW